MTTLVCCARAWWSCMAAILLQSRVRATRSQLVFSLHSDWRSIERCRGARSDVVAPRFATVHLPADCGDDRRCEARQCAWRQSLSLRMPEATAASSRNSAPLTERRPRSAKAPHLWKRQLCNHPSCVWRWGMSRAGCWSVRCSATPLDPRRVLEPLSNPERWRWSIAFTWNRVAVAASPNAGRWRCVGFGFLSIATQASIVWRVGRSPQQGQ